MVERPRPHVLLVEDEILAAMALEEGLKRRGYRVTVASDGIEALDHYQRERPAILVTDLRMPRMDGGTLVRRLRAVDPTLPVVVMTGYPPAGGSTEIQGEPAGPLVILCKPVSPSEIAASLKALLDGAAA